MESRAEPQPGNREKVLEVYKKTKNVEDAYSVAKEINRRIGKVVYTKSIIDKWIQEYKDKER